MRALDPLVMLATGMHSQPGVYALLLGSGVSTGAGIPTGWGVVKELVRRTAAATAPEDPTAPGKAADDPEAWWSANGDGHPLGYSNLLAALAPTQAARRDLLATFFEPTDDDVGQGLKVPGPAHHAIADLVKRKFVRIILTTNFDRLVERALEEAGIPPQVVSRPEAVSGMTPLAHSRATVVKLHGDYTDLQSRNTIEELSDYPAPWMTLLDQVVSEYGLLVSGWSAEWDVALLRALEAGETRRYPLYWDSRSSLGVGAQRLIAQRQGHIIEATSADELFGRLDASIDALDRLAEPPLSAAIAVARLKRYLPDPVRRIDLHDLVMSQADKVREHAASQPINGELTFDTMEHTLAQRRAEAESLLQLLATGVAHDRDQVHASLWLGVLQRLLQTRGVYTGPYKAPLEHVRHYSALLALRTAGIVAVHLGQDGLLLRLLTEPFYRDRMLNSTPIPAVHALHDLKVLHPDLINGLPRWKGTKWQYPLSHLVRQDLREPLRIWLPDDEDYEQAFDDYEYRSALVVHTSQSIPGAYKAAPGEYIGDWRWTEDRPRAEHDFRAALVKADADWPWWDILGGASGYESTLDGLREVLQRHRIW